MAQRISEKNADIPLAYNNPDTANEPFEKSDFYGVENVRGSPACLEMRFNDSTSKALPYSFILEISYDPSEGIEIKSTMRKIIITGRNLRKLYLSLVAYRVSYIVENIGNDLTDENKVFIKKNSVRGQLKNTV